MNALETAVYPYDRMKLACIYRNPNVDLPDLGIHEENLRKVYGENLCFPKGSEEYPYAYASMVTSIDGRIAFPDAPIGPFIASKNYLAKEDSLIDWYTLNILRASADGIIFGANTLAAEPEGTGHVYDAYLSKARERMKGSIVPWNIIPTMDGTDIPFGHITFTSGQIPVILYTTCKGMEFCRQQLGRKTAVIDSLEGCPSSLDPSAVYIVVTGEDRIDNRLGLKILRRMGIRRLLVESPTLAHIFIREQLLDELFLDYSCVYLGGSALTIGQRFPSFTSQDHPHTELLRVYMHSSHFMFFRHRLVYNVKEG